VEGDPQHAGGQVGGGPIRGDGGRGDPLRQEPVGDPDGVLVGVDEGDDPGGLVLGLLDLPAGDPVEAGAGCGAERGDASEDPFGVAGNQFVEGDGEADARRDRRLPGRELADAGADPELIRTVSGVGYAFGLQIHARGVPASEH